MRIFFDSEFTGLHQNTTLISLGLVSEDDRSFYAEFVDYDESQVDDWIRDNIISNLQFEPEEKEVGFTSPIDEVSFTMKGDKYLVSEYLRKWLKQFDVVELWSDCLSYDWVLLSELIADRKSGYPELPENFSYHSPYDILVLFKIKKINPDMNREEFAGMDGGLKHNALRDAMIIKGCYEKFLGK